jgi:hypothetical protein
MNQTDTTSSSLDATDWFEHRHIGLSQSDCTQMLETVGAMSLDALIDEAIPSSIRCERRSTCLPPRASISTCVDWVISPGRTGCSARIWAWAITTRSRRA